MREGLQSYEKYVSLDLTSDKKRVFLIGVGDCNGMEHLIDGEHGMLFHKQALCERTNSEYLKQ